MTVAVLLRRAMARPGHVDEDQVLGPCERGALVTGLELASQRGTDAVAIAVGPARREERVLAMALRAGCARAIRVGGEGLDELDYLGVAELLAAAARSVGAAVIVAGDQSLDERTGAVGPAVAEVLGWSHLTAVANARMVGATIEAVHLGAGRRLVVRVQTPAVLAVMAPPVRPSDAARAEVPGSAPGSSTGQTITAVDPEALDVDIRRLAPRRALVGRLRPLRGTRQATILPDAASLVGRLREQGLIAPAATVEAAPAATVEAAPAATAEAAPAATVEAAPAGTEQAPIAPPDPEPAALTDAEPVPS